MKRTMLVVVLALAASACAAPEQGGNNANQVATNINAATPVSSPTAAAAPDVVAKERQVWDAIKGKDFDGLGQLLADDMVYVSSDGIYDKAATIHGLKDIDVTEVSLTNFKTVNIDKDAAVVIYDVAMKGTMGGKPVPPGALHASSAWLNRGGKWLAVFHQDTEPKVMPTGDSAASNSNAPMKTDTPATSMTPAANASPSSTAAATATATDSEKAVWDALKRKDWDAFASFLASDSMEVEPEGVFSKAESVDGMKKMESEGMDMSGAIAGDFKETKLDDDATLVTYTVKGPRQVVGNGMRHSTIWIKRDGRWQAAFHHGTEMVEAAHK
ncbi:MAG: nuclear transport factor 2 family protein [Pyrinomonadaceae bacterium]